MARRKMANRESEAPPYRPLKVYAFDPTQGRNLGNYMTLNVPYEKLDPGPVGEYLAVIDYDASNERYYRPVNLDDPAVLLRGGLDPSESDPRFHQQMVYAVASETIRRFEFALGRKVRWGFRGAGPRNDPHRNKLRIFPHAMQEANAYYSRNLRAIVFGYFPASETEPGTNLPGQTVFTCLSHDIIVHETTHALIDGQRRFFMEPTGPDTPAFHEAFADIVALFQHFSCKEALLEMIQRTGGLIYRPDVAPEIEPSRTGPIIQDELTTSNPLVQLAKQFGEAMGMRAALRSALGTRPNSNDLASLFEPHDRGSILVAAVFDAFFSIYIRRTRDLMRIARAGGTLTDPRDLHPNLANRLAQEATKIAQHFSNICIRTLDYCPPVDILFGDFLRAMITADSDLVPDDPHGYRTALIEAFRLRGIRPEGVTSYAEESLRWCSPEELTGTTPPPCEGLDFDVFKLPTDKQQEENARKLSQFGKDNAEALGLTPGIPVQAHSFHPLHRVGPDGRLKLEIVAELIQQRSDVLLDPNDPNSSTFTFRGGATVVLTQEGEVRYAIQKKVGQDDDKNGRLQRQREYYLNMGANSSRAAYLNDALRNEPLVGFDLIHRGY
jgi:hypothetical protein